MNYFFDAFKNMTNFNGVATRKQFWMYKLFFFLGLLLILFIAGFIAGFINPTISDLDAHYLTNSIIIIWFIGNLLPNIAISVRRLHDLNLRGWWILLELIPYIGALILLVIYVLPSSEKSRWKEEQADDTIEQKDYKEVPKPL